VNPFAPLYEICNTGDPANKLRDLRPFPLIIDVEPVGSCNMRCVMCPTGLRNTGRPSGFMAFATWKAIVDECEPHGTALRCIGWGEPLLHPEIVQFIDYANDHGLLTHLNTNATKLTPDLAMLLVDAGLSSIKFSFQGIDRASYAEMRQKDFFDGMLRAIGYMNAARGPNRLPFIAASTSITDESPERVAAFRDLMEPLVDHLSIGQTTFDFLSTKGANASQRKVLDRVHAMNTGEKRHPDPCPETFDKLSIHWDGHGVVCCNDFGNETNLGTIGDTMLADMWRHPTMEAYRERLARKEYGGPLCSVCYSYMPLEGQPA